MNTNKIKPLGTNMSKDLLNDSEGYFKMADSS